jgi:hypothetical protein
LNWWRRIRRRELIVCRRPRGGDAQEEWYGVASDGRYSEAGRRAVARTSWRNAYWCAIARSTRARLASPDEHDMSATLAVVDDGVRRCLLDDGGPIARSSRNEADGSSVARTSERVGRPCYQNRTGRRRPEQEQERHGSALDEPDLALE